MTVFRFENYCMERALFGDKGYFKIDDKREARASGILWAISDRATVIVIATKKKHKIVSFVENLIN